MTDLTTLADFKAYAGVDTTVDDVLIARMITAYSGYVRQYTNRDFTISSYSRPFDGRNNTRQMVPQYPIRTVTGVQVGTQIISAASAFGQPGYSFDATSVMLTGYRFAHGESNVLISWTAGYDTPPVEIAQAVNELVGLRYANKERQGLSSEGLAGQTTAYITKDMPDSVRTILGNWRAVVPL